MGETFENRELEGSAFRNVSLHAASIRNANLRDHSIDDACKTAEAARGHISYGNTPPSPNFEQSRV